MTERSGFQAKVLYDYTGVSANQISLTAGELIKVTNKGTAGGWSSGINALGNK
jgi:hypothetical protein